MRLLDIELNITYRCNSRCRHCNRLMDVQPLPASDDMSIEQVEQFATCCVAKKLAFRHIKLAGGEPTCHPDFGAIVTILRSLVTVSARRLVVMTNGLNGTKRFGRRVTWTISPPRDKQHEPFLISPHDFRITGHYGTERICPITTRCGVALDAFGFTPCPVAGIVGRLAGVNPYSRRLIRHGRADYCRHCIYSVPPMMRELLRSLCRDGRMPIPTPTMADALTRMAAAPPTFPRWQFGPHGGRPDQTEQI